MFRRPVACDCRRRLKGEQASSGQVSFIQKVNENKKERRKREIWNLKLVQRRLFKVFFTKIIFLLYLYVLHVINSSLYYYTCALTVVEIIFNF